MRHYAYILLALFFAAFSTVADSRPEAVGSGDSRPGSSPVQTMPSWQPARDVAGVAVEGRPTDSGFDAHRARIHVCTDMSSLAEFVVDPSRFSEWVAFTRSARLLDKTEGSAVYYVRSVTPWPLKDTDMVYRITRAPTPEGLRLSLIGLPDYSPPERDTTRLRSADGEWRLLPGDQGIDVSYELYVDPGRVPRSLANQRLATAVGQTLANLAAQFPCIGHGGPP